MKLKHRKAQKSILFGKVIPIWEQENGAISRRLLDNSGELAYECQLGSTVSHFCSFKYIWQKSTFSELVIYCCLCLDLFVLAVAVKMLHCINFPTFRNKSCTFWQHTNSQKHIKQFQVPFSLTCVVSQESSCKLKM